MASTPASSPQGSSPSLLGRRIAVVLGLLVFVAMGAIVFFRGQPPAPRFVEDAASAARAFDKALGGGAPIVRIEIEPRTMTVHMLESTEQAAVYVVDQSAGYVVRGARRTVAPDEKGETSFALAAVPFHELPERVAAAAESLGVGTEAIESIVVTRPAGARWLRWRVHARSGQHVDLGRGGEPLGAVR